MSYPKFIVFSLILPGRISFLFSLSSGEHLWILMIMHHDYSLFRWLCSSLALYFSVSSILFHSTLWVPKANESIWCVFMRYQAHVFFLEIIIYLRKPYIFNMSSSLPLGYCPLKRNLDLNHPGVSLKWGILKPIQDLWHQNLDFNKSHRIFL